MRRWLLRIPPNERLVYVTAVFCGLWFAAHGVVFMLIHFGVIQN